MTEPRPAASANGAGERRLPAVLVVDDEADLRELLSLTLGRLGLDVDAAESVGSARQLLARNRYALCLTDMRLPDGTGIELVREVAARGDTPIAVITAYGSTENAVAALKAGAFDYLPKPVDLDQLRLLVRSALARPPAGGAPPQQRSRGIDRLRGEAPAMRQLRAMIERLAHSMAPVAIYGESGSGKELVARAIHDASARRLMPFVAVNCGAIPETLMEAEFFGYRKGAFTGAERDRDGFFHAAGGGTLFLDEVAELPLTMQVKLLRAIQERRVRKVGSTTEDPVDVRILSATHQDLGRLVAAGRFRQDLFYRLNVIELHVPSLRERAEDIAMLADVILDRLAQRGGGERVRLSPEALHELQSYPFPGNVRELENVLERGVALAAGRELTPVDLMLPAVESPPDPDAVEPVATFAEDVEPAADAAASALPADGVPPDLSAYLDAVETAALRAALRKTGGNRTAAAQLLGLTFRQFRYRLQRLGLK
ncbi:MAG: sigma-54-dependent Fis family transcriptional regulator [Burkholderiales bacterium]|jgi:two-component system response regulator PilR (NtrC family)|nr:sigma-54-dependent Fis family transcriptional regulator [Burkholderiales bacterium]